nr:MAG TPA: hypothetical protein [Caudoviricetes sp.]
MCFIMLHRIMLVSQIDSALIEIQLPPKILNPS